MRIRGHSGVCLAVVQATSSVIGQTHQQDLGLIAGPTVEVLSKPPSWQQIGLAAVQLAVSVRTHRAADVGTGFLAAPFSRRICFTLAEFAKKSLTAETAESAEKKPFKRSPRALRSPR